MTSKKVRANGLFILYVVVDYNRQRHFLRKFFIIFTTNALLGERDNETILKINQIIEEDKTKNLISKSLYLHVKGRLNKFLQKVVGLQYNPGIKYHFYL